MSDEEDDIDEEGEDEEGGGKKKVSGKKLILFIVLPLLVLIGAGAGLLFSGMLDPLFGGDEAAETAEAGGEEAEPEDTGPGYFMPLDEMTVTLRSSGSKPVYLKLQTTLELDSQEDEKRITQVQPRIKENFLLFLRELRVEELEGSEGTYRIREELLRRVNRAAQPVKVRNVLITDFLIQ